PRTPEPIYPPRHAAAHREDRPERRFYAAPEARPYEKKKRKIAPPDGSDLRERIGKARPPKREHQDHGNASHEAGMTRLTLNAGREHEITPGDIVGVIAGLAKVPKEAIGAIRLLARSSYVDIACEHAPHVLEKLNGIQFKGHKVWMTPGE
ncbi:MAG: DbpA RNA binding domain-containing protein, partial [Chthoniobacteraceae bacterium]|nr:DbpA RNA binding domain-containing protein [Chthoniobacteraceae bacterium]